MSVVRYHDVSIDRDQLAVLCKRWRVQRLALFGSILRTDFRPDSDIDILVELQPDAGITLLDMAEMEHELSQMLGRKVDLRTPGDLSKYFRQEVLAAAEVQYAA
jgi:predicted nucleotidyltransferase